MEALLENLMTQTPYPGLRPYSQHEADIFFGREEHVDQLLLKLQNNKFIAVLGSSGCGKSSLVRAGLIPALKAGFLPEIGTQWHVAEMRPGASPYQRLVEALMSSPLFQQQLQHFPNYSDYLSAMLKRGPLGLVEAVSELDNLGQANLLILVDQFEEIFRFRQEPHVDEAEAFIKLLMTTIQQTFLPVYVIITMRSDFLGNCTLFYGLPEAISDSQFLTPRLSRDQYKAIIEKPARLFGVKIDPALVNRLLNDIQTDFDQLPLLQHVLMRMWNLHGQQQRQPALITVEDYQAVGTLQEALSRHADEVYATLRNSQQRLAETMFRRLTERSHTQQAVRRPVSVGEIAQVAGVLPAQVIDIVEAFRQPDRSFLMPPLPIPLTQETVVDLSHESLMRQWKRLRNWIEEETELATTFRRLSDTNREFRAGEGELLQGLNLEKAVDWQQKESPTPAWAQRYGGDFEEVMAFIDQSQQHWLKKKKKARNKNIILYSSIVFSILLLLGVFLAYQLDLNQKLVEQNSMLQQKNYELATIESNIDSAGQQLLMTKQQLLSTYEEIGKLVNKIDSLQAKIDTQVAAIARQNVEIQVKTNEVFLSELFQNTQNFLQASLNLTTACNILVNTTDYTLETVQSINSALMRYDQAYEDFWSQNNTYRTFLSDTIQNTALSSAYDRMTMLVANIHQQVEFIKNVYNDYDFSPDKKGGLGYNYEKLSEEMKSAIQPILSTLEQQTNELKELVENLQKRR